MPDVECRAAPRRYHKPVQPPREIVRQQASGSGEVRRRLHQVRTNALGKVPLYSGEVVRAVSRRKQHADGLQIMTGATHVKYQPRVFRRSGTVAKCAASALAFAGKAQVDKNASTSSSTACVRRSTVNVLNASSRCRLAFGSPAADSRNTSSEITHSKYGRRNRHQSFVQTCH